MTRPTWVEISRERLLSNYKYLRDLTAPNVEGSSDAGSEGRVDGNHDEGVELLAVVKADAYGHDLSHCAPLLARAGAGWLGVTSVEEGVRARSLCRDAGYAIDPDVGKNALPDAKSDPRLLIMSGLWRGEAEATLEHRLTPVVWEEYHLDLLESAARKLGLGAHSAAVHLELDTGMSRQGLQAPSTVTNCSADTSAADLATLLLRFNASSPLRLEGVMTHFSAPEDDSSIATADQLDRLQAALDVVMTRGLAPRWLHAGSSATLIAGQSGAMARLQWLAKSVGARLMIRPGLALYGYVPRFSPGSTKQQLAAEGSCRPVLSWKTRVTSIRSIAAGKAVGYNSTFRAARTTRTALLPIGYADGLNRLLSNCGKVLIRGCLAPIAGRVSMDQTVIDVTDIAGVNIGDEVVIIGCQQKESKEQDARESATFISNCITAYDHADLVDTIPWEVLCDIAARVPRILVD